MVSFDENEEMTGEWKFYDDPRDIIVSAMEKSGKTINYGIDKFMAITNEILNYGLQLSMEFGENWLMPINQRLHSRFSDLNPSELERYNSICKQVNTRAHRFVAQHINYTGTEIGFIDFQSFKMHMFLKYDWISEANLTSLYSQSCYYAYK